MERVGPVGGGGGGGGRGSSTYCSQDILVGREEKAPFSKSSQQKGEIDQP